MPTEYYVKKTELNERGLRWCLANGYAVLPNQEEDNHDKEKEEEEGTATAVSTNNDSDLGQIIDDAEESKLSLGKTTAATTATNDDNSNPNLNNTATQSKEEATLPSASSNNNAFDNKCNRQQRDDDNSTTKQHRKVTTAASVKNLKRKNHNTIWVRIGKTDHQAYELYNPNNVISSKNNINDNNEEEEEKGSTMIWVEWLTTGKRECVHENQINRNGLEGRKRSRPSCFSP
jgi:hypothetical protein